MIQKVILNNSEINQIKELAQGWFDSEIHGRGYLPNQRKSLECNINPKLVESILLPHLKEYNIKSITGQVIILQYNKGCYFKRHRDRMDKNPKTTGRQQTLIIQLSNEDEYEGGELVVRDTISNKTKGNMILFDSGEWHELKELTKGTRYCLVTWLRADDYFRKSLI